MKKYKILRIVFLVLGYVFQYGIPVALFGYVVPLVNESQGVGLTTAGYIVVIAGLCVCAWKLFTYLNKKEKSLARAGLLAIFPIGIWLIGGIGLNNMLIFVTGLVDYWWTAFIFIILARIFFALEEHVAFLERANNE